MHQTATMPGAGIKPQERYPPAYDVQRILGCKDMAYIVPAAGIPLHNRTQGVVHHR